MNNHNARSSLLPALTWTVLASMLAGCGPFPATAEILIQNAKGGKLYSRQDSYEVKRPISQVTAVLKDRSSACLQKQLTRSYWNNGMKHVQVDVLTPKVTVAEDMTRLTVQVKDVAPGTTVVGNPPPDGFYRMVVNAYLVNDGTTRVETYFQSPTYDGMFTAIKAWVMGASDGCPDLTQ